MLLTFGGFDIYFNGEARHISYRPANAEPIHAVLRGSSPIRMRGSSTPVPP
jgi:hypothetical protein